MKIYFWNTFDSRGVVADGVVLADSEEKALEKVRMKYNNHYRVELDENSGIGINGVEGIDGLYVRWED